MPDQHKTILSPKDRSVVSTEIEDLNRRIGKLEAMEARLLRDVCEVQTGLQTLREQRLAMRSRIAAVWTLPNEILSYIFELGVTQQQEERAASLVERTDEESAVPDFQILVSHVSRLFRDVALHTPSLWTFIHVWDLAPPRLDYIRTFLERSGSSSSLEIVLDCADRSSRSFNVKSSDVDQAMVILAPYISRFKRFTAQLIAFEVMHTVLKNLSTPAPLLVGLELTSSDDSESFEETSAFEPVFLREPLKLFDGHVPNLTSLALDGVHVAWDNCNFRNLYDIHLGYHTHDVRPSWPAFKAIIDASPSLETLDLRGSAPIISGVPMEALAYNPVHMEFLKDMRISDIAADYAANLISLLIAPNLQFLALTHLQYEDYSSLLSRIAGPPALFPNLESLKLSTIDVSEDVVVALLQSLTKLKRLALLVREHQRSWLSVLAPSREDGEILCPKLEVLRCTGVEAESIRDLIEKRRDAGVPIRKLEIEKDVAVFADDDIIMKWLRHNAVVEIVEPSEFGADDENMSGSGDEFWPDSGSEWDSGDEMNFNNFAGIAPYFSAVMFDGDGVSEDGDYSEQELEEEEVEEENESSEMDVDYTIDDDSSGESS